MAKFEVEMELQGFKLRVKAERQEDVPRVMSQVARQIAELAAPAGHMIDGNS